MSHDIWQAKLAARIHDPAEKALVLLTDPLGHEGGTVRALKHQLFPDGVPSSLKAIVKRADHWASAADRPQFSQDENNRFARWAQVKLSDKPELVHPLTGDHVDLKKDTDLTHLDIDFHQVKAASANHFNRLIQHQPSGAVDWEKSALAFWRFGPELDAEGLKLLWQLLPADTRVPDHTIWAHLNLTSAFTGAMARDAQQTPALLVMSFGPVQSFIAQARSTSDLWAGSHLLSRMVWEGLKVICEQCGPDALLFPQLHGVPMVDAWLKGELGGWPEGMPTPPFMQGATDSNPLFAATLPNRFVALVPADRSASLAQTVEQRVRDWVMNQGEATLLRLLEKSGTDEAGYAREQLQRQLSEFPEVHWLAVPWSLVEGSGSTLNTEKLESALRQFYPDSDKRPGFLGTTAWELLSQEIKVDGQRFFLPNGGVLYPALFDLLERANASAKTLRSFTQQTEEGYRCSLCGEREWLTPDKDDLFYPPKQREALLWHNLPPSWSRKGKEQLCALCALKRLWPTLFAEDVKEITGKAQVNRFVISTHTMALVQDLAHLDKDIPPSLRQRIEGLERTALPAKLARDLKRKGRLEDYARLPSLLDSLRDEEETTCNSVEREIAEWLGHSPEAYYGFILMDGDKMGAWLQGNEDFTQTTYRKCWHTQIQFDADKKAKSNPDLQRYLNENRPVSPARHAAISSSLNAFALHLTRFAVEEAHNGKLLYAGGDDVMAMIPAGELTSCMVLLRLLYSGAMPEHGGDPLQLPEEIHLNKGFVLYRGQLIRLMGRKATASAGAVLAHHTAPLQRVLKELRSAEHTAKNEGGRDAFSIRVLKRGGGTVTTTAKWFAQTEGENHPIVLLQQLAQALGGENLSHRAAYHAQAWVRSLPPRRPLFKNDEAAFERMLNANLQRQFEKQRVKHKDKEKDEDILKALNTMTSAISDTACTYAKGNETQWLEGFLAVAEFMGREGRMGANHE